MTKITVDPNYCKGCLLCVRACRRQVLKVAEHLGPTGYYPVIVDRPEECNGCGLCHLVCPDVAITIEKDEVKK
jgi:2-oxoglutarate ferredoxin oxidoreductase subunit delta